MADVMLNRIGELLRSVLELLWSKPEGMPAQEILAYLPQITELTEHEKGFAPPTNIPRYERIVRLATVPLVQAGWLVKSSKGRWSITAEGRRACQKISNAEELYKEAVQRLEDGEQADPAYGMSVEEAEEKAWEQIESHLLEARPVDFRSLIAELLKAMGYHVAWVAPPEKERGRIDVVAYTDPVSAEGPRILVQFKHNGQALNMEGLESFLSALGARDYGLVVSSRGFTTDVTRQVKSEAFQKMTLLDLESFFDLWVRYYDELSEAARNRFPLKAIYFLNGTA